MDHFSRIQGEFEGLCRFVTHLVGPEGDPESLVQKALTRLFVAYFARLPPGQPSRFGSYEECRACLFVIIRRLVIDWRRRQKAEREALETWASEHRSEDPPVGDSDPDSIDRLRVLLREAVRGMPLARQAAMRLWFRMGRDRALAAQAMGRSAAAYSGQLHHAWQELREVWIKYGELFDGLSPLVILATLQDVLEEADDTVAGSELENAEPRESVNREVSDEQ